MKKILIQVLLGIILTPLMLSAQQQEKGYTLTGHIANIDREKVYLTSKDGGIFDSTIVENGKFAFKGKVEGAVFASLQFGKDRRQSGFFLENKNIEVVLQVDSLDKAKYTGSLETNNWQSYVQAFRKVSKSAGFYYHLVDSLEKGRHGKRDSSADAILNPVKEKLENYDFQVHREFIEQHLTSCVCPFILQEHFINYFELDKAKQLFDLLAPEAKNSFYGKMVSHSFAVANRSAVGATPKLEQPDSTGSMIKLSQFKGKYVLVDFWASWCGPCRAANPDVVKIFEKYHSKGLEIWGISLDNNKRSWLNAVSKDGLKWMQASDLKGWKNDAAIYFGIKAIPTNFLIDRDGTVIGKNLSAAELEKQLGRLLD